MDLVLAVLPTRHAFSIWRLRHSPDLCPFEGSKFQGAHKEMQPDPATCQLFGYVLTKTGIEVQPEKVEAVEKWQIPRYLVALRSFVRLCSTSVAEVHREIRRLGSAFTSTSTENAGFRWDS